MNQEIMQPAPVQPEGLSPEQTRTAIDLRQAVGRKTVELSDLKSLEGHRPTRSITTGRALRGPSFTGLFLDAVEQTAKQYQLNKANKAAAKHFIENEGAYQVQAVKEATEAGVELNGWYDAYIN